MKAYVTSHIPGVTLAQVVSDPVVARSYGSFLAQASSTGWEFEQVDELPSGLLVHFSSPVAAHAALPNAPQIA